MQKSCRCKLNKIHTYYTWFIPEGKAETSQIFLRDTYFNPLVTFNDIHGRKSDVLFFGFVQDSTRDNKKKKGIIKRLLEHLKRLKQPIS
jgi:hypothetical protein